MLNRTLLGLAIAAALPVAAQAHDEAPAATTADQQIVVRDADSGKLRAATAEEAASLATQRSAGRSVLRANAITPQVKYHANGATGVRVTEEMMSYSVLTRTADGKLVEQCFPNKEAAEAAIKNGAAATQTNLPTE